MYMKNVMYKIIMGCCIVAALPQCTIPDDKLLVVELYEKNGGRHQTIRVENADIVNAEVIDELKIK